MLYCIHRIDRTMQNAEAGGNRLHDRYGVQVAKHHQPFPQFRSIPHKHDIQPDRPVQPCRSSNRRRGGGGGVLISKLSFFVLFLSVSLLIAETARSCDIIFCFFPSFFASQCYSNNCLATFPLEQSHFGQGATVGKMGLVSGGSRSGEN